MKIRLITTALLFSLPIISQAYTIDGDWSDWITPSGTGQTSDWIPNNSAVTYTVEDQNTNYLNPGYGGQNYDAEAIYVQRTNTDIYIAVITGRNPASGYPWGDIALDFGNDGSYEYGLVTYGSNGYHNKTRVGGNSGDVYQVSQWNVGIWDAPDQYNANPTTQYALQHPTSIAAGALLGSGNFAWSAINGLVGTLGGDHYFMEGSIPLALLNQSLVGQSFTAHWTMGCANDWIQTTLGPATVPDTSVPEPTMPVLLTLGLIGLVSLQRKQQN